MSETCEAREPLWLRWWASDVIIIAMCVFAVVLAFFLAPGSERVAVWGWEIPELCGIKRLTGYSCPGCGLTRSWVYLAHGDWRTAFSMNLMGPILFLAAVLQIPLRGWRLLRGYRRRALGPPEDPTTDEDAPCHA